MASPIRITEPWRRLVVVALVVISAPAALAHDTPRTAVREIVRLQGHFEVEPAAGTGDVVELSVLGKARSFRVGDRQVFITVGAAGLVGSGDPRRIVVRGARELLVRLAAATPEQLVTLLGERRPGSSEVFLAAVDLCPERPAP